ncbi:MAG: DNA-directed RNA polymerase subunit alpha C-terminal domain-containing protein [Candidatus Moranbacteria bacterium]|nr:DNA-directed RNA polymerase subunit alpha C-terminal domain-containing protein [Candidatus Moranbacteria bacterium]
MIQPNIKKLAERVRTLRTELGRAKWAVSLASAEAHGDNLSLLNLPTLAENALLAEGIDSLKKLVGKGEDDLADIPGIGRNGILAIKEEMERRNMYLLGR